MDFDELKAQHPEPGTAAVSPQELLATARARSREFDHETRKRTWFGALSFLLPVPLVWFIFLIAPGKGGWMPVVEWTMVAFLIGCAAVIIAHGMKHGRDGTAATSLREFAAAQLTRIERQARLFRSLKWWFWTPMLGGWLIFTASVLAGRLPSTLYSLANIVLVPALAYYGIRAGRRYLEREILPWQREFDSLLKDMNET